MLFAARRPAKTSQQHAPWSCSSPPPPLEEKKINNLPKNVSLQFVVTSALQG